MIFPGFPGVLSFFQVFQVEWEPCTFYFEDTNTTTQREINKEFVEWMRDSFPVIKPWSATVVDSNKYTFERVLIFPFFKERSIIHNVLCNFTNSKKIFWEEEKIG